MGWAYYDANGYVADAASLGGWESFRRWAETQAAALADFARRGWTEDLTAIQQAAKEARPSDPSDASVLRDLVAAVGKADTILILTDGTGMEA